MIKAGIIGATGYAGNEIVRLLLGHKDVEVAWYGSRSYIDQKYADVYQNFFKLVDAKCMDDNMEALADEVDVIFTATPQGLCASLINEGILSKAKVIDLSADFRIKDVKKYEKWYGIEHKAPQFIDEAVYGLCEINREEIKKARLIANPGVFQLAAGSRVFQAIEAAGGYLPEAALTLSLIHIYEVHMTVEDGGDFDLSETEKEIKISAVLGI